MNVFFFLHRIDTIKIMWTKKETYKMALRPCTSQLNFQTSRSDRSSSKTLPLPTVEAGPKQDLSWYVTGVMRATYIYILLWKGENKREGRSGRWEAGAQAVAILKALAAAETVVTMVAMVSQQQQWHWRRPLLCRRGGKEK